MREMYIHCGLHKTGTSALQKFFRKNHKELYAVGVYYSSVGTVWGGGHHNLAWELFRERRYVQSWGDIDTFLKRLKGSEGDAVISSEDFETVLLRPALWSKLVPEIQKLGFNVTFVVYLRDPVAYLESLFMENLKHRCGEEFATVARSVVETGVVQYGDWTFNFEYDAIARQLAQVQGTRAVFRSFERLVDGSIVHDFFSVMGREIPESLGHLAGLSANQRPDACSLLQAFVDNRLHLQVEYRSLLLEAIPLVIGDGPVRVQTPTRLADVVRSRLHSQIKSGLDAAGAPSVRPKSRSADEWVVNISRFFSWETQVILTELYYDLPGASDEEKLEALKQGDNASILEWREWVSAGL